MEQLNIQNVNPSSSEAAQQGLDYKALFRYIIYNWYWVVLSLALSLTAAWLMLRYSNEQYQVTAKILVKDEKNKRISEEALLGGLASGSGGGNFNNNRAVEDEIQLLRSTKLMERVVDSLHLNTRYFTRGRVKTGELYQEFPISVEIVSNQDSFRKADFNFKILDATQLALLDTKGKISAKIPFGLPYRVGNIQYLFRLNPIHSTDIEYRVSLRTTAISAKELANKIKVSPVAKSNALDLRIADNIAERGASILLKLVEVYNDNNLEEKNAAGRQTLQFVDGRLKYITDELSSVEKDVEAYRNTNKLPISIPEQGVSLLAKVTESDKELAETETRISILDNYEQYIQNPENRYKVMPLASEWINASAATALQEYNLTVEKRNKMLVDAKSQNPIVASMDDKFNALRQNIVASIQIVRRELQLRRERIKKDIAPIETKIGLIPKNEREYISINRQQRVKESLFLFLLQKREETALSVAAQTANAQFLEKPQGSVLVYPKRAQTYVLAFLIGLLLPLILLNVLFALDNKITSKEDLARITQAPFLGMIGLSSRKENVVVKKDSRSSVSEMFRMLRTNLTYLSAGQQCKTIMVTSTVGGDGKSFISINLAATIALSNKRVLIVGLDLRKPKMSLYLTGKRALVGITNYLTTEGADWRDYIQQTKEYDNLFFIDCGPTPPNPAELLVTDKMTQFLRESREEFDFVIVDTAPVALVADALMLKDVVDQAIVVTRFKKTTKDLVRLVDEVYRGQKLPRIGIVLNAVETSSIYGYGYGYGYGNTYGVYSDKDDVQPWWKRLFKRSKKTNSNSKPKRR